jgi:hypothetical protein
VNNELEWTWKEVVGMNLRRDTGYPDGVFVFILSPYRDMPRGTTISNPVV